ncbi:hypothetical protein [Rhizobium glycinendophyticum]|uniref:Uncharacterized protein n=1 Tax=Rhizobium glycinendophyticum TaxID=2589807 RepID=A0A504UGV5_9HYPH|nr:hypothetical protein [Rhizobium glycinendophyticum]TPP04233.1 hypothetical protein FJQ55_22520 [Rhizobium glycinendophyticum]
MRHHLGENTVYIKDALRGIRFAARRGHEALKENAPRHLPSPASSIAVSALGELETIAKSVEGRFNKIARTMLGVSSRQLMGLSDALEATNSAYAFSDSYYRLIKVVLERYGVEDVFMSQRGLEEAFTKADRSEGILSYAAHLLIGIARLEGTLTSISKRRPDIPCHDLQRVAAFATMVAMLVDTKPHERIEVAYSAAELVLARRETVIQALTREDLQQTLALLEKFCAHV